MPSYTIDLNDRLNKEGELPTDDLRARRVALRLVRLVEYGGPLRVGEARETLVECRRRPKGKRCFMMVWVTKLPDERLYAWCPACRGEEIYLSGWQDTLWADGPMEPVPPDELPPSAARHDN